MNRIVVVGASAGGIPALQTIVSQLPPDFPAPMLVVVHISDSYKSVLPTMLNRAGPLDAVHPFNGQRLKAGTIFVASPAYHMVVIDHHIQLKNSPKENRHRPAIDPLFRSAAHSHGDEVIGVILSGAMDDGTGGLIDIKQHGGVAVAQDPEDAMFSSMPESACRYVDVDHVLPASKIAGLLSSIVREQRDAAESWTEQLDAPQNRIAVVNTKEVMLHDLHDQPGEVTPYACPDCNGNLWVSKANDFDQYWCHIGHRYTKRTLLAEKLNKIEATLFEAIRNLKEGTTLGRELLGDTSQVIDNAPLEDIQKAVQMREKQLQSLLQIIEQT